MTLQEALAFVRDRGIVLESGRGPAPRLAELVAGEPLRGTWWGHPRAGDIFRITRGIRAHGEVLVCRLVDGKITYVHRRLWPALVRVAGRLDAARLAAVREIHTEAGHHRVEEIPFPGWVPEDVRRAAEALDEEEAAAQLPSWLAT